MSTEFGNQLPQLNNDFHPVKDHGSREYLNQAPSLLFDEAWRDLHVILKNKGNSAEYYQTASAYGKRLVEYWLEKVRKFRNLPLITEGNSSSNSIKEGNVTLTLQQKLLFIKPENTYL